MHGVHWNRKKNNQTFDMCNNFSFLFKILFVYIQHCIYGRNIRSLPAQLIAILFSSIERRFSFILKIDLPLSFHHCLVKYGLFVQFLEKQYVTPVCFAQSILIRRAYIFHYYYFFLHFFFKLKWYIDYSTYLFFFFRIVRLALKGLQLPSTHLDFLNIFSLCSHFQ